MRSYRTISPLPFAKLRAVCFLWHFPGDLSRSLLGTTMPCGARTFLPPAWNPVIRGAVAWPPFADTQYSIRGLERPFLRLTDRADKFEIQDADIRHARCVQLRGQCPLSRLALGFALQRLLMHSHQPRNQHDHVQRADHRLHHHQGAGK